MYQYLSDGEKKRIFNVVFITFILLAAFLGAKALNAFKENSYIGRGDYPGNTISVNGTGEVIAVPDIGSLTFSVVEEGKTVKEAQDKATTKINSAIAAIKAMGIEERDIKTIGYNSYPKYEYSRVICAEGYCPPGKQNLVGYEVSQSISLKIRNTAEAGDVLTKIGGIGVSNISGLDFVVDDIDSVSAEARDKAIKDAQDKAKTLSKSLGVKLVKIVSFSEGGVGGPIYYSKVGNDAYGMGAPVAQTIAPEVPMGENKIVSNITITYEVE